MTPNKRHAGSPTPAKVGQRALLLTLLAILGVFLVYPILLTVRGGFAEDVATGEGWTARHVILVFRDPALVQGLVNAFVIAAGTTALSFAIGLPLAVVSAKGEYPGKGFWNAAVLVPLILPPFVGAIGIRAIFGRAGALNALLGTEWDILGEARIWGVIIALALHLYPIVYLNAAAALANLDPALDEAAEAVGSGPIRRFLLITLPLIRPGLFAGGAVVFIWAFTELGTPLVFDFSEVTSVQIFNGIQEMDASARPYALTIVMLAFASLIYLLGKVVFGRSGHGAQLRATRAAESVRLKPLAALGTSGLFGIVTLLALLPHAGVILMSLSEPGAWYRSVVPTAWTVSNYEQALGHPLAFGAIMNSLQLALSAMFLDILLGLAIGYLVVRTTLRGRHLLDLLSMLPLAVPGLVMAFGYVALSLRWPFGAGDPLEGMVEIVGSEPNPFPLLIIAYAVRRLPYIVRATVAGLEQVTVDLEQAALNLGASMRMTVRRIIVPLIRANLLAGGLLAFAFSMLEVSDSLVLAQQERHYPITKAILTFTERLGDGMGIACALGVWGMLLLTVTLAGASILLGRSLGSLFRV